MPETQGQIGPVRPDGRLGHTAHLRKGRRGPGSAEYEFDVVNSIEYDTVFMDFREATMPVDQIGSAGNMLYGESGSSTAFVKLTPTIARPSDILGVISNENPSRIGLSCVPQFLSEMNPFVEVCFEVEAVTNFEIAIGFVDAIVASAASILLDIDTPTLATDYTEAVVMGLDTAQTLATGALVGENGGGTFVKADFAPTTAPYGIPTLATKVVWRLELRGDRAYAYVNGALVAQLEAGESAATGVLLGINMVFSALSATAKNVHIDYIYYGQERADLLV